MNRRALLRSLTAAALLAALASPAVTAASDLKTKTVRYGPFTAHPGVHAPGHTGMSLDPDVPKPCRDCFLTAARANLVYANGERANYDTDAMLHHVLLLNRSKRDATCPTWAERFFASGNERTPVAVPSGYGYRVKPEDKWGQIVHVMGLGEDHQDVFVEITFRYKRAPAGLERVRPLWLDIDNCGDSEYSIPKGGSVTHRRFEVGRDIAGKLLTMGGHLHDHGVEIKARNVDRKETLCKSRAGYGRKPSYQGHIESMTGCLGDPLARLRTGDVLKLHSVYDSPRAYDDVMGIMLGYVDPWRDGRRGSERGEQRRRAQVR